jgi:exonuclease III
MLPENLHYWILRGLNVGAHRNAIRELVRTEHVSFVCLQETKMVVISDFDLMQILGPGFDYFYLSAVQSRGGIMVAWCSSTWVISSTSTWCFSVLGKVHSASGSPD